ncbi:DUF4177 domain-containing protein [Myxococcaceae bacterium JPH2]|nr:DUF4177 domain-containing protein [Myxococcaceae bacterium JPH2]
MYEYHVDAFVPPAPGCGAQESGWSPKRCGDFAKFLNGYAAQGWKLHSSEYRAVTSTQGCGTTKGSWLVCVFERALPG